jgi:hypothetical protein
LNRTETGWFEPVFILKNRTKTGRFELVSVKKKLRLIIFFDKNRTEFI